MSGSGPAVSPSQEAILRREATTQGRAVAAASLGPDLSPACLPVAPSEGQIRAVHSQPFPPHWASPPVRGTVGAIGGLLGQEARVPFMGS